MGLSRLTDPNLDCPGGRQKCAPRRHQTDMLAGTRGDGSRRGNGGGPGNPLGGQVARLRSALVGSFTEDDMAAIARWPVAGAKVGDLAGVARDCDRHGSRFRDSSIARCAAALSGLPHAS